MVLAMDRGVSSKWDFIFKLLLLQIFLGGDGEKCQLQGLEDKIVVEESQFDDLENDEDDSLEIKSKLETEENLRKLEIERLAEENLRKQKIEGLAEENFSKVNKLFVYPQVVKPDIEVFLNRSLSTLSSERDFLIMGALNDYL
ncbi:hypothetical protein Peur_024595 [Populus x canadensis]